MLMSQVRIATIGFVAVMFGVVQILCACTAQAAPASPQAVTMQAASGDSHGNHDMAMHGHSSKNTEKNQGHHHDGGDCAHCSGDLALASSSDGASALKTVAASSDLKTFLSSVAAPITPANLAPSALDGLRWLDPPRPTLTSQKVLLLI